MLIGVAEFPSILPKGQNQRRLFKDFFLLARSLAPRQFYFLMATAASAETLPKSKDSVIKREPLPVIETPPKQVVLVKEKSQEEKINSEDVQPKQTQEMEVDLTEDVISPDNQT